MPSVQKAREILRRIPGCTAAGMAKQLGVDPELGPYWLAAAKAAPRRTIGSWSFRPGDRCRIPILENRIATILEGSQHSNGFGFMVKTDAGLFHSTTVVFLQENE